jgi:hypothetical protein
LKTKSRYSRLYSILAGLGTLAASVTVVLAPAHAATGTATAATVNYWNDVLLEAFRREGGAPTIAPRAAAIMHIGIHEVLNAAHWQREDGIGELVQGYLRGDIHNPTPYRELRNFATVESVDDDLAAGLVARDLLSYALPNQATFVAQEFSDRHGTAYQPEASSLASRVYTEMLNERGDDGFDDVAVYSLDGVPGAWRPTGNGCTSPVTPHWGDVDTFYSVASRPALPGGYNTYAALLASSLYASQVNEVKLLGEKNSTSRTADQTQAAFFWANDVAGTYKPPGHLLSITAEVANNEAVTDPVDLSRIFAHVSMALSDSAVAAWDAKYESPIDLWRPETAIQLADTDGNASTQASVSWQPLSQDSGGISFSPCFPAWVSGHATFAGAWAEVMESYFGSGYAFSATSDDPNAVGVTRSFASFQEAAEENARSRVYLGVHYQFDADDGLSLGSAIGSERSPFEEAPCGDLQEPCIDPGFPGSR